MTVENDEDIVLTIMRERGSGSDIELVEKWHQEFLRVIETKSNINTKFEDVKNLLAFVSFSFILSLLSTDFES